jgi:hypothetical protein
VQAIDFLRKGSYAPAWYQIWLGLSGFSQSETRFSCGSHVCYPTALKCEVYRIQSLEDLCQISDHLAKWFKRKRYFRMHSK